jgi:hypothetical protein
MVVVTIPDKTFSADPDVHSWLQDFLSWCRDSASRILGMDTTHWLRPEMSDTEKPKPVIGTSKSSICLFKRLFFK